MRNELGLSNTHKNCVTSLYLPYSEGLEGLPLKEQATTYRQLIKEQRSPDAVRSAANSQIGMSDRLDSLETLAEKKEMLSFFDDLCINTFVVSYLVRSRCRNAETLWNPSTCTAAATEGSS